MFEYPASGIRVYVRYSRLHPRNTTFYGLRRVDLRALEGRRSYIAFTWDRQSEPLLLPYEKFEDIFDEVDPASDGQYKVQVLLRDDGTFLYVAKAGKFDTESFVGWSHLEDALAGTEPGRILTHGQVQTLLGSIGHHKRFNVWIPRNNRAALDLAVAPEFPVMGALPPGFDSVASILQEIDVLWTRPGSTGLAAAFEIEHSTPIYSGLLRLNDVRLVNPHIERLTIVSDEPRRGSFTRQLNRPTFTASGLSDVCSFLEYSDVYDWHERLSPMLAAKLPNE